MRPTTALVLAAVALGGCASSQAGEEMDEIVPAGAVQFDGSFRPIQQSDGRVGMNTQQRVFGSVRVLFRESSGRSLVSLNITTNLQQTELLAWGIVPGRCGSGGVPVLPTSQFPALEISSTGRGEINPTEIQMALPMGTYHVNVYRGGETLSNVIACANLTAKAS